MPCFLFRGETMKKIIVYALSLTFLCLSVCLNVFAQEQPLAQNDEQNPEQNVEQNLQTEEEKKAAEEAAAAEKEAKMREYGEKKADLELQLATLSKDKKIASQDKNKELESKRTAEIRQTRKQIKDLNKEYGIDDGEEDVSAKEPEREKKKSEPKLDMNVLNNELAREIAKMEGREYKEEKPAPVKKSAKKSKKK
jgi:hypothetical protein